MELSDNEIIYKNGILIVYHLLKAPYSWVTNPFNQEDYVCLLVVNNDGIHIDIQNHISKTLVESGCKYAVCAGRNSSVWEDSIDWAYLSRCDFQPSDDDLVMTTCDENESIEDTVFFFMNCTRSEYHCFKNFLILFIGNNETLKNKVTSEVYKNLLIEQI